MSQLSNLIPGQWALSPAKARSHCHHCGGTGLIDEVVAATGEIVGSHRCADCQRFGRPLARGSRSARRVSKEDFAEAMECLAALASGPSWSGAY